MSAPRKPVPQATTLPSSFTATMTWLLDTMDLTPEVKSAATADIQPPSNGPPQATTLPSVFMAANEWMLVVMLTTSEKVTGPLGK